MTHKWEHLCSGSNTWFFNGRVFDLSQKIFNVIPDMLECNETFKVLQHNDFDVIRIEAPSRLGICNLTQHISEFYTRGFEFIGFEESNEFNLLLNSLKPYNIETLSLIDCKIHNLQVIGELLKKHTLIELVLSQCNLNDHGLCYLIPFIRNSNLLKLYLPFNCISDYGIIEFSKILPATKLIKLHLNGNDIHEQGGISLANAILHNNKTDPEFGIKTGILSLDISYNYIGDQGGLAFAKVMQSDTSLKKLNLCMNCIRQKGMKALDIAFRKNIFMEKFTAIDDQTKLLRIRLNSDDPSERMAAKHFLHICNSSLDEIEHLQNMRV